MTEITKGEWTTLSLHRAVHDMLKRYKELYKIRSFDLAVMNAVILAQRYRKMAELVVRKEMSD